MGKGLKLFKLCIVEERKVEEISGIILDHAWITWNLNDTKQIKVYGLEP